MNSPGRAVGAEAPEASASEIPYREHELGFPHAHWGPRPEVIVTVGFHTKRRRATGFGVMAAEAATTEHLIAGRIRLVTGASAHGLGYPASIDCFDPMSRRRYTAV
jgi:hypothetical protein